MPEKEFRRSLSILPIGTVMELTGLSARQIRYYETHKLVVPKRNQSNRRMYSLNDTDKLLEIKDYLNEGNTIADVKAAFNKAKLKKSNATLSDSEVRRMLANEMLNIGGFESNSSFINPNKL
ncbi:MerR family transcriptional regulator [Lentilactobacillus laojiaonis]|uniref:MerR family transcriptional regulator n=1 Tax=Lentilactobacillus laojiaonis TaxID=2883998 RepID=UPI001D0A2D3C|nr:MerR family transcriptional regulator [Lentilactobacillus laojiaonis]UDM32624.1 MerR family transcriptional regulator [Lentilactobacillus laojiaonis]